MKIDKKLTTMAFAAAFITSAASAQYVDSNGDTIAGEITSVESGQYVDSNGDTIAGEITSGVIGESGGYRDSSGDTIAGEITGGNNTFNTLVEDINAALLNAAVNTGSAFDYAIHYTDQAEANAVYAANAYTDQAEADAVTAANAYTDNAEADAVTAANTYTDGRETAITTAYQAYADTAEADANAYADGLAVNYDGAGSAATAEANAYAYADGLAVNFDAAGSAATAEANANAYTDGREAALQANIDTLNDTVFSDDLGVDEVGIAGTITRNTATGEIHIGENSLVTNEVNGVQQLYATDVNSEAIDIDVTNGSNLLINGDAVATQVYADQVTADEAQARAAVDEVLQAIIDQNESESAAADAANAVASVDADAALQADINQNELDSDAANAAIQADSYAAYAAIQADIDQNELDSDAANAALQATDAYLQQQINDLQTYIDSAVAQARADGVTAGIQAVTSDPQSYQLYSESSILEMNVSNPTLSMLNETQQAQVEFTLETSTDLEDWAIEERIQRTVQATGDKFFVRISSGAPYVTPTVVVFNHPSYGEILTDQDGNVLYGFSIDSAGGDPLYSGSSWPLASHSTDPEPDADVTAALTSGTYSNTSGGPWLKINDRPVYTYVGDSEPNQASGHGLGFVWFTIKADGSLNQ